jgi:hypothetical protein
LHWRHAVPFICSSAGWAAWKMDDTLLSGIAGTPATCKASLARVPDGLQVIMWFAMTYFPARPGVPQARQRPPPLATEYPQDRQRPPRSSRCLQRPVDVLPARPGVSRGHSTSSPLATEYPLARHCPPSTPRSIRGPGTVLRCLAKVPPQARHRLPLYRPVSSSAGPAPS